MLIPFTCQASWWKPARNALAEAEDLRRRRRMLPSPVPGPGHCLCPVVAQLFELDAVQ